MLEKLRVAGTGELRKQVLQKTSGRNSNLLEDDSSESEQEGLPKKVEPVVPEPQVIEEFNEDKEDVELRRELKAKFSLDPHIVGRFKAYYEEELK